MQDMNGVTLKVGARCRTKSGREVFVVSLESNGHVRVQFTNGFKKKVLADTLTRF